MCVPYKVGTSEKKENILKIKKIYNYINEIAPFSVIDEGDNVGLIIGSLDVETEAVLIALDLTEEVIAEAVIIGAKLIVTHHPPIYLPLKSIESDSVIYKAIQKGLTVISAHTNLDIAKNGVNDQLCEKLGLTNTSTFANGLGRLCTLEEPIEISEFTKNIKQSLGAPFVNYLKETEKCHKIAVICGGGGGFFDKAAQEGIDTFITGEAPHHVMIEAHRLGINVICAGHFHTENIVCQPLCKMLTDKFPNLKCETSLFRLKTENV